MNFIFGNEGEARAAYQAEVPVGIKSKAALLEALFVALRFPDYFGGNWDALDECIRDLCWLPSGDVVLRHRDLPMPEDRASLSTYLAILKDAVEKWRATRDRRLFVVFPPNAEGVVRNLLANARNSAETSGGGQT
jgi:hypothetical protein